MRVGAVAEDENLVTGLDEALGNSERVSEGSEEEDEMLRKRRKQLAERWSKLGNDSVSLALMKILHVLAPICRVHSAREAEFSSSWCRPSLRRSAQAYSLPRRLSISPHRLHHM